MLLEVPQELLSKLESTKIPSPEYSTLCDTYSQGILQAVALHDPKTIEIPLPVLCMLVNFIASKVRYGMSANLNLITGMLIRYIDAHEITDESLRNTLLVALGHHRNLSLKDIIFAQGAATFYAPVLHVVRDNIRHVVLQNRSLNTSIKQIGRLLSRGGTKSDIRKAQELNAQREIFRARALQINNIIRLHMHQIVPVLEHALKMQSAKLLRININDLISFIATCGLMDFFAQVERANLLLYMVRLANTTVADCSPSIHLAIEFLLLQTTSKEDKYTLLHYINMEAHFRTELKELFKQALIAKLPRDVPLQIIFPAEVYEKIKDVFGISDPIISSGARVILTQFSVYTSSHSDAIVTPAAADTGSQQTQQTPRLDTVR